MAQMSDVRMFLEGGDIGFPSFATGYDRITAGGPRAAVDWSPASAAAGWLSDAQADGRSRLSEPRPQRQQLGQQLGQRRFLRFPAVGRTASQEASARRPIRSIDATGLAIRRGATSRPHVAAPRAGGRVSAFAVFAAPVAQSVAKHISLSQSRSIRAIGGSSSTMRMRNTESHPLSGRERHEGIPRP